MKPNLLAQLGMGKGVLERWAGHHDRVSAISSNGQPENVIMIYGPIVSSLEQEMYERWGYSDEVLVSGKSVLEKLGDITGDIVVRINSPGGDVWECSSIVNAFLERIEQGDKVDMKIDGLAASAASVIMLTGTHVLASPMANIMIHKASGWMVGNSDEMRKFANVLDKTDKQAAKLYSLRSKLGEDEAMTAMAEETWYTADEAMEVGLVDEVRELPAKSNNDKDDDDDQDMMTDDDIRTMMDRRNSRLALIASLHE